jgi:membrane-bound lytic murein transglycosylase B
LIEMRANGRVRLAKQASIAAGAAVLVAASVAAVQLNISDTSEALPAAPQQDRLANTPYGADGGTVPSAPMPDQARSSSGSAKQLPAARSRFGTGAGPEMAAGMTMGIPTTVLDAYQHAADVTNAAQPGCHIPVSLLAAIGRVESGHASGGRVDANGTSVQPILGPMLNGAGVAAIGDSDNGVFDGSATWDRAVGPMQFIPSTWRGWASDGNGDGRADPHNVYDASLASARYLCAGGRDLSSPGGLDAAILSYNHSSTYLHLVRAWMNAYGSRMVPVADNLVAQASLAAAPGKSVAKTPMADDQTALGAPVLVTASSSDSPPSLSGSSETPAQAGPQPILEIPGAVQIGDTSTPTGPPLLAADLPLTVSLPPLTIAADVKLCVSLAPLRIDLGLLADLLLGPSPQQQASAPACGGGTTPPPGTTPPGTTPPGTTPPGTTPPGTTPPGTTPPGTTPPGTTPPGDPGCIPCAAAPEVPVMPASNPADGFSISGPR